ncbi:hypothetical protein HDV57DRAFT_387708 [Trichoderma longibrachiatum]
MLARLRAWILPLWLRSVAVESPCWTHRGRRHDFTAALIPHQQAYEGIGGCPDDIGQSASRGKRMGVPGRPSICLRANTTKAENQGAD